MLDKVIFRYVIYRPLKGLAGRGLRSDDYAPPMLSVHLGLALRQLCSGSANENRSHGRKRPRGYPLGKARGYDPRMKETRHNRYVLLAPFLFPSLDLSNGIMHEHGHATCERCVLIGQMSIDFHSCTFRVATRFSSSFLCTSSSIPSRAHNR